jgi:hypothetical protein
MLKKILASAFLVTVIFTTFSFAQESANICEEKLDICMEKCAAQSSDNCEESCEIEFNICLDTVEEPAPKN